jgi:murein DD-endopeptidase MepM/ murein hydrolase activator NlpD
MRKYRIIGVTAGLLALILAAGCMPQPPLTPTPTKTPFLAVAGLSSNTPTTAPTAAPSPTALPPTATLSPTPSSTATATVTFTPTTTATVTPTWTPPPPENTLFPDHFYLQRPIPEGYTNWADRTYAYGSTGGGQYRTHHAIDIQDTYGTPVVAVANGEVFYAGADTHTVFGPQSAFYGYLIVLQIDQTYHGQPIYTLYGHLGAIHVEVGQRVNQGDVIGEVGAAGVANGPHLHFEVRIGDPYDYDATRNPDLWIQPWNGYGVLAGLVTNRAGTPLTSVSINVADSSGSRYTWSYADASVTPDDEWGENFTLGDLPEGYYTVTIRASRTYQEQVYIYSRRITWVEFELDQ